MTCTIVQQHYTKLQKRTRALGAHSAKLQTPKACHTNAVYKCQRSQSFYVKLGLDMFVVPGLQCFLVSSAATTRAATTRAATTCAATTRALEKTATIHYSNLDEY